MTPQNVAALVNLLGFITGAALYGMLLAMVLRAAHPAISAISPMSPTSAGSGQRVEYYAERLLLATALLGLLWNLGALILYGSLDWGFGTPSPWFGAAVFTSLGFLPAVVVHSVLRSGGETAWRRGAWRITALAYALSSCAAVLHFYSAWANGSAPSIVALRGLTFGFSGLTLALLLYARRSPIWRRAFWVVALAVFAVSALHISQHTSGDAPWFIELIGHHSSLPLVIAMLYQDYRFALADIFLKRALALIALVTLAFGLYVVVAAPLLRLRDANGDLGMVPVGALLGLWMGTALAYPWLRRFTAWFVDTVILRRTNYQQIRSEIARIASSTEETVEILDQVCLRLSRALTANEVRWHADESGTDDSHGSPVDRSISGAFLLQSEIVRVNNQEGEAGGRSRRVTASVLVPTHESPRYSLVIGELSGGRRLLSDDLDLLESIGLMLARRIDAIRVTHERCERNLREQEISKLATEAELRALRAQLNPHFLFNALTTISYLIQTSPDRALETLMKLTGLLRAVLRAPSGEFTIVGDEMDLIESYLAIERARFEERLRVRIDVPAELRKLRIPQLVVQPLVENAVKHGIAPHKNGGEVVVSARLEDDGRLCITIRDTGAGVSEIALAQGRKRGVGLANVKRRLECYYGDQASLEFKSSPGEGAVAEIRMPVSAQASTGAAQARVAS